MKQLNTCSQLCLFIFFKYFQVFKSFQYFGKKNYITDNISIEHSNMTFVTLDIRKCGDVRKNNMLSQKFALTHA